MKIADTSAQGVTLEIPSKTRQRLIAVVSVVAVFVIISLIGVLIGAVLTVGLNILMIETFSLTRIAWYLVPVAMLILLIIGQITVFGPAKRASSYHQQWQPGQFSPGSIQLISGGHCYVLSSRISC